MTATARSTTKPTVTTTTLKTTISTSPSTTTTPNPTSHQPKYQDEQKTPKSYFSNSFYHNNNNRNNENNSNNKNNQLNRHTTKSPFKFVNNFSTKSSYKAPPTTTTEIHTTRTKNPYYTGSYASNPAPSTTKSPFVFSKYTFASTKPWNNNYKYSTTKKPELTEINDNHFDNIQLQTTTEKTVTVKSSTHNPVFDIYFRQIGTRKPTKNPYALS